MKGNKVNRKNVLKFNNAVRRAFYRAIEGETVARRFLDYYGNYFFYDNELIDMAAFYNNRVAYVFSLGMTIHESVNAITMIYGISRDKERLNRKINRYGLKKAIKDAGRMAPKKRSAIFDKIANIAGKNTEYAISRLVSAYNPDAAFVDVSDKEADWIARSLIYGHDHVNGAEERLNEII